MRRFRVEPKTKIEGRASASELAPVTPDRALGASTLRER